MLIVFKQTRSGLCCLTAVALPRSALTTSVASVGRFIAPCAPIWRPNACEGGDSVLTTTALRPTMNVGRSAATRGGFPAYSAVQADTPKIAEYALQMHEEARGEHPVDDAVIP